MKMRNTLSVGLVTLTLSLGLAAPQAFAGGSTISIEQYGSGNGTGGGQHGWRNRMTFYQSGRGNSINQHSAGRCTASRSA